LDKGNVSREIQAGEAERDDEKQEKRRGTRNIKKGKSPSGTEPADSKIVWRKRNEGEARKALFGNQDRSSSIGLRLDLVGGKERKVRLKGRKENWAHTPRPESELKGKSGFVSRET